MHNVHEGNGIVAGSPFHVDVIDFGSISVSGDALYKARVNHKSAFTLDLHGLDVDDLDISVMGVYCDNDFVLAPHFKMICC